MGLFKKLTPEQQAEEDTRKAAVEADRAQQAFDGSWPGRAMAARCSGDQLLQVDLDLSEQRAFVVSLASAGTRTTTTANPNVVLNAVCKEGWELVTASMAFVETGQQSRDKLLSSGQQVAVSGRVVGYYLFRRIDQ